MNASYRSRVDQTARKQPPCPNLLSEDLFTVLSVSVLPLACTVYSPGARVRKEKKIRPGYTPQEDVRRFRGTKQAQLDANALPKGHIIGWAPPPVASTTPAKSAAGLSKSAKKNEKRKEKRKEKAAAIIKENWEDDDEDEAPAAEKKVNAPPAKAAESTTKDQEGAEALADKLEQLDVR